MPNWTTGGPANGNGVISLTGSGTAIIVAVDSFVNTGCYTTKDTTLAVSASSAQTDIGRVIFDGTSYILP